MTRSRQPKPWSPVEVAQRIERARGALLARTGREVKWADIGRLLRWSSSATASEAKSGTRPLRVEEIGEIAQLLECSAGWLAFAQGPMWAASDGVAPIEPGVDSYTTGEDAEAATAREIAAREEAKRQALRLKRAVGLDRDDRASGAPARGSARGTPGARRRGR